MSKQSLIRALKVAEKRIVSLTLMNYTREAASYKSLRIIRKAIQAQKGV